MRIVTSFALALFAIVACTADEKPTKATRKPRPAIGANWVTVGEEKRISETEDMRLLRFPFPVLPTDDSLDTVCIIYRNHEFKSAQVICPAGAPEITGLDLGIDPQR